MARSRRVSVVQVGIQNSAFLLWNGCLGALSWGDSKRNSCGSQYLAGNKPFCAGGDKGIGTEGLKPLAKALAHAGLMVVSRDHVGHLHSRIDALLLCWALIRT